MEKFLRQIFGNEGIRYIFFGACTTLVNVGAYAAQRYLFGVDVTAANMISIALAILFAYVVNKQYVFKSRTASVKELLAEAAQFIGMRLGTMFLEVFGVVFLSSVFGIDDMVSKLAVQAVVLALNYLFSKLFVFNKEKKELPELEKKVQRIRRKCCFWGFTIPAVVVTAAFIGNGVFPFGDRGVLIIDSLHQYLPFFTEFHEKLVNSESLLYSFGGGLGYNFWATIAYYLASPMNFLVSLFPKEHMMDVMALFIVLKIGLCGLTMTWYFTEHDRGRSYYPIAFGTMFGLSSFIIGYYFNLMWLESIAMLPLVMRGIERIVKDEKKKSLYCLALFYALYCNYYIGFMLCLFSCLYFLVQWVSARKVEGKRVLDSCLTFGWYSLLAGGMAAIILLPAFVGLGTTESAQNSFPSPLKFYVENLSQLTSHFAFVEPINIADDQIGVNAFCGTVTMILGCLYALDKRRSIRERASKLLLIGFLYASFDINVLNFIWHGFHVQNGLPNRFAFIYIAMLLSVGFDVMTDLRRLSWERVAVACVPPMGFAVYSAWTGLGEREPYVYTAVIVLLAVYSVLLLLYRSGKKMGEYTFRCAFMSLVLAEMTATGAVGVCMNGTVGRSTYVDEQKAYEKMIARRQDNSFYRSDIDSSRMRNENMFMGGNGVVLFSSTMPAATVDICKSLGIEARTNKNGYNGFTKLANDIFGVKYIVSQTDTTSLYQMEKVDYEEPLAMYQNTGALSLGFMVNSEIKEWDIEEDGTPLDVQNRFIELATGSHGIFFENQEIAMYDGETYEILLPAGKQAYLYLPESVEEVELTTPQYSKSYDRFTDHLYDLGCFAEDNTATVTVTMKEGQTEAEASVYVCDDAAYKEMHALLADEQMELDVAEDGKIRGRVTAKEAGTLLLSIPYDEGWSIKADGQEITAYRVGQALTGIDLESGEHEISMDYTPPGLWPGTAVSLVCIALYLVTAAAAQKRDVRIERREAEEAARREEERKRRLKEEKERSRFSRKSQMFQAGIFAVLNKKKEELEQQGRKIYNLSVGTPDFKPAPHVMAAIAEAAKNPENYRYALTDRPFLLEAVQDFYRNRFGVELMPEEIMTINGSQEGMAHITWALCNPGDVVLVPNPGYPIFSIGPALCDAKVVEYPLYPENGFLPKFADIPAEMARRAKFMLVSYPLNPVCAVADDGFYEELIAFARKYQIIIIHDNAYSDIIYGERIGKSFLAYEGAKEVGVELYSLSKSYNLTGARISFVLGNREIVDTFRAVRTQIDYGMFLPLQYGAAAALSGSRESVEAQRREYEARMEALCGGLREIGWDVPDSQGTMFVWAPLPKGYEDSNAFCMELMERAGVICVPGSSFGSLGEGFVRFALVEPVHVMKEIVEAVRESGILVANERGNIPKKDTENNIL